MKILITGVCGFIGFNLANQLVSTDKKNHVYGIDNLNNYYSVKLKKTRLNELKKNKNFNFYKFNLNNEKELSNFFRNKKIDIVIHLAAQAGVQHSMVNPKKHIDDNINSYFNILDICKNKKIKKIIYASSSSIYGDNKKFPIKENASKNPKNIYGLSKKFMEEMSEVYSTLHGMQIIGMRFFSVFGEWGRPDMLVLKYLDSSVKNKKFYLNNFGNHYRDFTYIGDVVKIINLLIRKKVRNHQVFNICSNNPIKITSIFKILNNYVKKPLIKKRKFQPGDIIKSHGDNNKIKKFIKFKNFSNFKNSIEKTVKWYFNYNKIKNQNIKK